MPEPYRPPPLLLGSLALHAAAAVALAAAPRHWRAVAGLCLADHVTLAAASLWPRGQWVGPNLLRLPAGSPEESREIALTFDDGPDPGSPRACSISSTPPACGRPSSSSAAAPAPIPMSSPRSPAAATGSRTTPTPTPTSSPATPPASCGGRSSARKESIAAAAGRRPRLFRAPAGLRNPLLDWVLHNSGLRLVAWTRRGFDAVEKSPAAIARRLLGGLAPGDILLLHDGRATDPPAGNPVVLEVLPRVLDALAAQGLRSVPIPDPPGTAP